MTQVKALDYAEKDGTEYVKVTFSDDTVILLDTDAGAGKQAVLDDLDRGDFDYFFQDSFRDTVADIAKFHAEHPDAERIYG